MAENTEESSVKKSLVSALVLFRICPMMSLPFCALLDMGWVEVLSPVITQAQSLRADRVVFALLALATRDMAHIAGFDGPGLGPPATTPPQDLARHMPWGGSLPLGLWGQRGGSS